MTLSIEEIRNSLKDLADMNPTETEKTIFSIGGRGHYENPISDVLAFYLNTDEDHGFGNAVLKTLLDSVGVTERPSLSESVLREAPTENQKRLDLVLVGDDWVMAIENKIYHEANNPFDEYEEHLAKTYPSKTPYFVLLSPKGDTAEGWTSLGYDTFVANLKSNLGEILISNPFSKWGVFFRDFLINLSNYVKDASMDDERFNFLQENVNRIYELEAVKDEFFNSILATTQSQLTQALRGQEIKSQMYKWSPGPAFRFYPAKWPGQSNVTLHPMFKNDSKVEVLIYIDGVNAQKAEAFKALFTETMGPIKAWSEGENDRWACYQIKKHYDELNTATEGLIKLAKVANQKLESRVGAEEVL